MPPPAQANPLNCDVTNSYLSTSPKLTPQRNVPHVPSSLSHHTPYPTWPQSTYYPQTTSPYPQYPDYHQSGNYRHPGYSFIPPPHPSTNNSRLSDSSDIQTDSSFTNVQTNFNNLKTGGQMIYA